MSSKQTGAAKAAAPPSAGRKAQKKNKKNKQNKGQMMVSAPIARSLISEAREPVIRNNGSRSCRIVHRELLASVAGATSFTVQSSYVLNPGMSSTFPWLSTQASGWEQFHFHKLEFHYIPRCATTKVGSVLMAPDYDSSDAAPTSELIASSYRDSVEGSSWAELCCKLHPGAMFPIGPRKFVRSSAVAYADYKAYDAGKLHMCVTEQDDTTNVGKLWVDYDCELFVPQNESSAPTLSQGSVARFFLAADNSHTSGVAKVCPFDTTDFNSLGITLSSGTFTLPKGVYEILVHIMGQDDTGEAFTVNGNITSGGSRIVASQQGPVAVSAGGDHSIFFSGYMISSGSSTFTVRTTLTGAAGALQVLGTTDYSFVAIRLI